MIGSLFVSVITFLAACDSGTGSKSITASATQPAKPYATTFPLTENPISENHVWTNGGVTGIDWTDVRTILGLAFGTQSGSGVYNDSIAILAGVWGPDQTVIATVHTDNQQGGNVFEEVEILLRFRVSAHSARGYEINFRALNSSESYSEVVRWNGPLANFSYLAKNRGQKFGITDGSVVKASIIRDVIRVFINGVQVSEVVDDTYTDGNPGMGFFTNTRGVNSNYGFTRFTATDGMTVAQLGL